MNFFQRRFLGFQAAVLISFGFLSCASSSIGWSSLHAELRQAIQASKSEVTVCIVKKVKSDFSLPYDRIEEMTKQVFSTAYPDKNIHYLLVSSAEIWDNKMIDQNIGGSKGLVLYLIFDPTYNPKSFSNHYHADFNLYAKDANTNTVLGGKAAFGMYQMLATNVGWGDGDSVKEVVQSLMDDYPDSMMKIIK